jgi:adenosylmethionine-8-amino-7-oxononanoate aminotransferase
MKQGETEEQYVQRLAKELDDEFQRLGPDTVCAFIAETVSGTVSLHLGVRNITNNSSLWDAHLRYQGISKP